MRRLHKKCTYIKKATSTSCCLVPVICYTGFIPKFCVEFDSTETGNMKQTCVIPGAHNKKEHLTTGMSQWVSCLDRAVVSTLTQSSVKVNRTCKDHMRLYFKFLKHVNFKMWVMVSFCKSRPTEGKPNTSCGNLILC